MTQGERKTTNRQAFLPATRIRQSTYDAIIAEARKQYRTVNEQINFILDKWTACED